MGMTPTAMFALQWSGLCPRFIAEEYFVSSLNYITDDSDFSSPDFSHFETLNEILVFFTHSAGLLSIL